MELQHLDTKDSRKRLQVILIIRQQIKRMTDLAIAALDSVNPQEQMSLCVKLRVNCDKRNEHMPPGKIMTGNDFLSPLHKDGQVRGSSCCARLMVLPDVAAPERVTKLGRQQEDGPGRRPHVEKPARGDTQALIASVYPAMIARNAAWKSRRIILK